MEENKLNGLKSMGFFFSSTQQVTTYWKRQRAGHIHLNLRAPFLNCRHRAHGVRLSSLILHRLNWMDSLQILEIDNKLLKM